MARRGKARQCRARHGSHGKASYRKAGLVEAGMARLGEAKCGGVRRVKAGMARCGELRLGRTRQAWCGKAWYSEARRVAAGKENTIMKGNTMKYRWVRNAKGGLSAQVVGEELERLESRQGKLTPEGVLEFATPAESALHDCFEWDDTKAAHEYRLNEARYILRSIEVVVTEDEHTDDERRIAVRAFPSVQNEEEERVYVTIDRARKNDFYWQQVREKAMDEIKRWQQKYKDIKEFEAIFSAIKQVA